MEKTTASGGTRTIRMMMLSATLVGVVACDDDGDKTTAGQSDIVATADAAGSFDTLVAAVRAADLETTLKGAGPFTVFAPTNDAFDEIPDNVWDSIIADPDLLASIVGYHIVVGTAYGTDELVAAGVVDTLSGPLTVASEGPAIVAGGAATLRLLPGDYEMTARLVGGGVASERYKLRRDQTPHPLAFRTR